MKQASGDLVVYLRVETPRSPRLAHAQRMLRESVESFGLRSLEIRAGEKLVTLGDVLSLARAGTVGRAFVWCNSDVVLTKNPFHVPDEEKVYGFHRREIPSGETTLGVDMYYLPVDWWDGFLSKDIPKLYLGAGYVDWWISRAMQSRDAYENLTGYIDHVTHEASMSASSDANRHYQQNFRAYNKWAKRNGLDAIPAPPYLLPGVGHVWGVRHAAQKVIGELRRRFAGKW